MYVICTYTRIQKHATRHLHELCVFGSWGSGVRHQDFLCLDLCLRVGITSRQTESSKNTFIKKAMNLLKPV